MSDILPVLLDSLPALVPVLSAGMGTAAAAIIKAARRAGFERKSVFVVYCDVSSSYELTEWLAEHQIKYMVHLRRFFQRAASDGGGGTMVHVVVHRSVLVRCLTTAISLGSSMFDDYGSKSRYTLEDLKFLILQVSRRDYESCNQPED